MIIFFGVTISLNTIVYWGKKESVLFYAYICFHLLILTFILSLIQIEKPLQKHGGRLEHNEAYCGSCFGAETVHLIIWYPLCCCIIF
jgi:hypothetical protein